MYSEEPNTRTVSDVNAYDYLNYTPYELNLAFAKTLNREFKIIDEETSMICKNSNYLKIDPDKFPEDDMRSIMNLYMKCKIMTIKKYGSMLESDKIDSWNAIFTKIAGTNVTPINSGAFGTISRGNMDGKSVIIKTGKDITRSRELMHEYTIGLYLNSLYTALDNFPLVYGILSSCSIPYVASFSGKKYLLDSCNQPVWYNRSKINRIGNATHLIMEDLGSTMTLSQLITSWNYELNNSSNDSVKYNDIRERVISEYYMVMIQLLCALSTAYKYLKFVHGDLHGRNVLVEKLPRSVGTKTLEYQLSSTVIKLKTKYIVKIIDYGFSSIKVNCSSLSDGTGYGTTEYKTYALDSLSGVEVPWVDVYRITGLSALTVIGYVAGYQTYDQLSNNPSAKQVMPLIEASSYLYGLIINYPKDVVKREKGNPLKFDDVVKSAIKSINRNKDKNRYYLTNHTAANLPSSECAVFMMLNNQYIFKHVNNKVSINNTRIFYDNINFVIPKLKDYEGDNYIINDDFDTSLAIVMNENKGDAKSNKLMITPETPFNERVENFLKYFIDERIEMILNQIGNLSNNLLDIKEPSNGFMLQHYKNALQKKSKPTDEYYTFIDAYMLMLDTALLAKTEVELMLFTLSKMGNRDQIDMKLLEKLIIRSNLIINKMNETFSLLTIELYLLIRNIGTSKMNNYIVSKYINDDKYPSSYQDYYRKLILQYYKYYIVPKISNVISKKYNNVYVNYTKDISDDDKTSYVEMLTEIVAYYLSGPDVSKRGNHQSMLFKILTFEPIQTIDTMN